MEAYIELLGTVGGETIKGSFKNGAKYILFRTFCKNTLDDDTQYFNCIIGENMPAFNYAQISKLSEGDLVLVRGKFQQKFVWEDKYVINQETRQKEYKKMQVCKNRVYVTSLLIVEKADKAATIPDEIITNQNVKIVSNTPEHKTNKYDNPFGD